MGEKIDKLRKIILLYILEPLFLDFVIESLNRKSCLNALVYMVQNPLLFAFNVLLIVMTLSISRFFKKEMFAYALISIVWLVFGIANFIILQFRVTPFSAVDFKLISNAISVASHYLTVLNVAMIVVGVIVVIVAVIALFRSTPVKRDNYKKSNLLISLGIVVVLVALVFEIHKSSSSVQALTDNYTNIQEAYENYGFVYCFTNSLLDTGISEPEGYSKEMVDKVVKPLREKKVKNAQDKPNVIMIQLESFFDVSYDKNLTFSTDPLPIFHALQKKYTSGLVTVPTVGAGTVNTEFEILTGMNQKDFGTCEYPYKTVLKKQTSESICTDLKNYGYACHVVHDNTAKFYGRNVVFSNLGFDDFTSVEFMNDVELNPNGWAKDNVMVSEIMKGLKSTKEHDFTFGITVQSHGKYEGVTENVPDHVKVYGAPEDHADAYNYYVNEIYEVDQMIGELIQALKELDEETILVLYGDHLPSLDLTEDDLNNGSLYQTQYVIWDNFGLEKQDEDLMAYQLYPRTLEKIGLSGGIISKYHQQTDWTSGDYLSNLTLLEYDQFYGEQYAYNGVSPFVATDLKLGNSDFDLQNVRKFQGKYLLVGDGFTPYSRIYVNGKEVETMWKDSKHLVVDQDLTLKEDEDTIWEVRIIAASGAQLAATNQLLWNGTGQAVAAPVSDN
mgnify:FL=1